MGKNIVLCADGTGNIGGETPDSNVYRIYKLVELHDGEVEQVKFYDNGVGTAKNKYWRAISGAFGGGFKGNVCDLYQFLARSYDPGDRIFLFGFSRGAATVRAFSGFVATSGLIDGRDLRQRDLRARTEEAYEAYKKARSGRGPGRADEFCRVREGISHGVVPIEVLGVWDSVAALGLPQHFKPGGLIVFFVNAFFTLLDKLIDVFLPHRFHEFELTENIRHAYHAIAIDDERLTFSPMIFDENKSPRTRVEQVWFAGAHSNVGGGYGRSGLSSVALVWMLERVKALGLRLENGAIAGARNDMNAHGRLFDSRDGLSIYYRYAPRDIEQLCADKLRGPVAVHCGVLERVERRTANYAPGLLPREFEVVDTELAGPRRPLRLGAAAEDWSAARQRVGRWSWWRSCLYSVFLEISIVIFLLAAYSVASPPASPPALAAEQGWQYVVWYAATYVLPASLESLAVALVLHWAIPVGLLGLLVGLLFLKGFFRDRELAAREDARRLVHAAWDAVSP